MRVGLFSGSFNPIHIGHLAIANYLCAYGWVDEVWFMVSPHNPLKTSTTLWDDTLRLQLVKIATEGYKPFRASDFEFHLPRPSYTYYTLEQLQASYPERTFKLIIGSDNWLSFDRWKEPEKIRQCVDILVYPRLGYPVDKDSLPDKVYLVDSPQMEISSTFIREALQAEKDVRYFLHPRVWDYLTTHGLATQQTE